MVFLDGPKLRYKIQAAQNTNMILRRPKTVEEEIVRNFPGSYIKQVLRTTTFGLIVRILPHRQLLNLVFFLFHMNVVLDRKKVNLLKIFHIVLLITHGIFYNSIYMSKVVQLLARIF